MSTEYSTQAVFQLSPHTARLITSMTSDNMLSTGFLIGADIGANYAIDWNAMLGSTLSTVTSTNDVVVPLDQDGAVAFMVSWFGTSSTIAPNLNVSVGNRWRNKLADFDLMLSQTSSGSTYANARKWIVGPFESARFGKQATSTGPGVKIGAHYVRFALTTKYTTHSTDGQMYARARVAPFSMPRVTYDT